MSDYLALFPIVLLQVTAAALIVLRLIRPAFSYSWLIAAFSAVLAWVLVLFSRSSITHTITLFNWEPDWLFAYSPVLLIDQYSWVYALCLASLLLSAILTDAARQAEASSFVWTSNLLLGSLGIAAVQAGNPLTLLLLWTAIDLVEGIFYLYRGRSEAQGTSVILIISSRVTGTLLLIWTMLFSANAGMTMQFGQYPQEASLLILASAFLRLGIIPLRRTDFVQGASLPSLYTVLRLVVAATGLILITRSADVAYIESLSPYLIVLFGLVAIYTAVTWAVSPHLSERQPYWIIGLAAFSIIAAVRSQPDASLSWGVLLIMTGGLLYLASIRNRYLMIILVIGLVSLSTLPFTPAWSGVLIYSPDLNPLLMLFLVAQSVFLAGYMRFSLLLPASLVSLERWVWIIYPWGLVIIPLSEYIIGWQIWNIELSLPAVLPGVFASLLAVVWVAVAIRLRSRQQQLHNMTQIFYRLTNLVSFAWITPLARRIYNIVGQSISFLVAVIEGEGGVLWALFFLVLFIAILTQIRLGV